MKRTIDTDEWWPVYTIDEGCCPGQTAYEFSAEQLADYADTMARFSRWQAVLSELLDKEA